MTKQSPHIVVRRGLGGIYPRHHPRAFTPHACVASNDIGLGRIVEAAMRNRFCEEMMHSARTTTQPDINGEVQS